MKKLIDCIRLMCHRRLRKRLVKVFLTYPHPNILFMDDFIHVVGDYILSDRKWRRLRLKAVEMVVRNEMAYQTDPEAVVKASESILKYFIYGLTTNPDSAENPTTEA